jgi:hypothetical protein
MENHLPSLVAKYGDKLQTASIEVATPEAYEVYLAAIELFNIPPVRQGVPAIYIGDTHLVGVDEVAAELDGLIQRYLDQGGVDFPPLAGFEAVMGQEG